MRPRTGTRFIANERLRSGCNRRSAGHLSDWSSIPSDRAGPTDFVGRVPRSSSASLRTVTTAGWRRTVVPQSVLGSCDGFRHGPGAHDAGSPPTQRSSIRPSLERRAPVPGPDGTASSGRVCAQHRRLLTTIGRVVSARRLDRYDRRKTTPVGLARCEPSCEIVVDPGAEHERRGEGLEIWARRIVRCARPSTAARPTSEEHALPERRG